MIAKLSSRPPALDRLPSIRAELRAHPACDDPDECDTEWELRAETVYCLVEAAMYERATIDDMIEASGMSLRAIAEHLVDGYDYHGEDPLCDWSEALRRVA